MVLALVLRGVVFELVNDCNFNIALVLHGAVVIGFGVFTPFAGDYKEFYKDQKGKPQPPYK